MTSSRFPAVLSALVLASAVALASAQAGLSRRPAGALRAADSEDGARAERRWIVVGGSGGGGEVLESLVSASGPFPGARPDPGVAGACGVVDDDFFTAALDAEGDTPTAATYSPDGATLVIAHRDSQNLIVYDAATRAFVTAIAVSGSPQDVAITPDGRHAVTANVFEDQVSIFDAAGNELGLVGVGDQPASVRITPNGATAVVGNFGDNTISVVDIATLTEVRRIAGAGFAGSLSLAPEPGVVTLRPTAFECVDDVTVVHGDFSNAEIDFFDITTGGVVSVPATRNPFGLALTPGGATAVVTHLSSPTLTVVDTASKTIAKTIDVGQNLQGPVAVNPTATKAAAHVLNNTVVVDLVTDAVSPNLATASLQGLLTTADGLYALGVGFRGPLISYASETIVRELDNVVSVSVGAVSPTHARGALVADLFGEDLLFVDTNGAAGSLLEQRGSGPGIEADKARRMAVAPGGGRAVVTNVLSDTASVVDLATGAVEAVVAVGDRPSGVGITPDGAKAVVANLDSTFASVIDLASFVVTNVPISTRASEVAISPDGRYAYLAVVASGDGVWRIDLASLTTAGPKLLTGNMGSVGFLFVQSSGIALSPSGSTLAVCGSFDDRITLIDTASWSVAAHVAVGDFPTRALFSADGGTLWVSNRDSDSVSVVRIAGAASRLTGTIAVGDFPFELAASGDERFLYVGNANDDSIGVVSLARGVMVQTIPVSGAPQGLAVDGNCLYVTSGTFGAGFFFIVQEGVLDVVDLVRRRVVDTLATDLPPGQLGFSPARREVSVPSPFGDGVTKITVQ